MEDWDRCMVACMVEMLKTVITLQLAGDYFPTQAR
jgi:hypothetical protein